MDRKIRKKPWPKQEYEHIKPYHDGAPIVIEDKILSQKRVLTEFSE